MSLSVDPRVLSGKYQSVFSHELPMMQLVITRDLSAVYVI